MASEVPERWVEMFAEGWHSVPPGQPGDRRRAGLGLVLADLRQQVAALNPLHDVLIRRDAVLDLLNTGGDDA